MRRSASTYRVLAATGVAVMVASLTLGGAAWAKGPKPPKPTKVTCTALGGNSETGGTLTGCNGEGGTGTFGGFGQNTNGTAYILWANGGTTNFSYGGTPIVGGKKDKCPGGAILFNLKGAVTGNTGFPAGNAGVKGAVKAAVCAATDPNPAITGVDLSLEKGAFKT